MKSLENTVPEGSWSVTGIGSTNYPVKGYGDAKGWTIVNGSMKPAVITKVLYVPELGTNLFCISAVTRLGWEIIFSGTEVRILSDKKEFMELMVGERTGRTLYLLKIHPRSNQDNHIFWYHPSLLGFLHGIGD